MKQRVARSQRGRVQRTRRKIWLNPGSISDLSRLRADITRLTQTVSDLAQKQLASSRDQVAGVVGAAGDNLSQSAAAAQEKFAAMEGDVEARIKKNPWMAVAVAGLIGLLISKMS